MDYQKELALIIGAARAGGDLALAMRDNLRPDEISVKGDPRDILTMADPAVQERIFEMLEPHFPGHAFIGEEGKPRAELEELARNPDKVLVDPIDGTTNFARGASPHWGTIVCLLRGHLPVAGAIYYPALGLMLSASRGGGCFLNERRLTFTPKILRPEQAVLGLEWYFLDAQREDWQIALTRAFPSRAFLSAAYSTLELVWGGIDAYLNVHTPGRSACAWDFPVGHLCLEEMVSPEHRQRVAFFPDGNCLSYEDRISMEALLTPYPFLAQAILSFLR